MSDKAKDKTILVYDCRDMVIKYMSKTDLTILPPEMFMYVVEIPSDGTMDTVFNDIIKYRYKFKGDKQLDRLLGRDELKNIPFEWIETAWFDAVNITYKDVVKVIRYWYLTKEEINKRLEGDEQDASEEEKEDIQ